MRLPVLCALCVALVVAPLLSGCRVAYAKAERPTDAAGDTSALRYILEPGRGAIGVPLVPIVRWDKRRLKKDLGGKITRLTVQVATMSGEVVYRAEGTDLGQLASLRIFSRPEGAAVEADPQYAERGRLAGARRYQVALYAVGEKGKRLHEFASFETEEAPRESGD